MRRANGGGTYNASHRSTPDEIYDGYLLRGLREGYVVREQTPVLTHVRPLGEGEGYEIYITRSHIEKRKVTDLKSFRVLPNEWGQGTLIPAEDDVLDQRVRHVY